MPFVYDREVLQDFGNKRRKVRGCTSMARRQWEEDSTDPEHREDLQDQPLEAAEKDTPVQTSNREELIECIKSGKSTVWIPSPTLERLAAEHASSNRDTAEQALPSIQGPSPQRIQVLAALPAVPACISHAKDPIERPRSALHAGDFGQHGPTTEVHQMLQYSGQRDQTVPFKTLGTSPPPWLASTPASSLRHFSIDPRSLASPEADGPRRNRAPSVGSSLSSSFVMRIPTSPLVNATSHTSCTPDILSASTSPETISRRRTLPPESFRSLQSTPGVQYAPNFSRPFVQPQMNRENSLPTRGHQPRRSLTSFTYQPAPANNMTQSFRMRRPSASSDASPRASMVGSFEESILRGRMSTAPSKPIDFIAQIGVLGKGNCKPSLRCPSHAIVPFPAVFYNYTSIPNSSSAIDENPSPYVGNIDLEHYLKPVEKAKQRRQKVLDSRDPEQLMADITAPQNTAIGRALARDAKGKRPAAVLKAPPGGCYRIPREGQLQIIIKNPNKTAVKLYLVPYDLTGMEPGTKTFVRQRSYSAGPIIEKPISADVQNQRKFDSLQDKHILRYLIHLKICCLSEDRFYLYDNVRVVFANRVLDGKEKLRNETQLPHPKYSPYKPGKEWLGSSTNALTVSNHRQHLKRRTSTSSQDLFDEVETLPLFISEERDSSLPLPGSSFSMISEYKARSEPCNWHNRDQPPIPQLPFQFRDITSSQTPKTGRPLSPTSGFQQASTSARSSPVSWSALRSVSSSRSFSPVPPESGDGLLSRKLRGMSENPSESDGKHE